MTNFKVGDRFKVVNDHAYPHFNGKTGIITEILLDDEPCPISGTLYNSDQSVWDFDEIELIDDEYTPKVGDKIRLSAEGVVTHMFSSFVEIDGGKQYNINHFEVNLIEKAPERPKVGDPWRPGLPQGTVIEITTCGYKAFRANGGGWVYSDGYSGTLTDRFEPENTKIVYLPEDSE